MKRMYFIGMAMLVSVGALAQSETFNIRPSAVIDLPGGRSGAAINVDRLPSTTITTIASVVVDANGTRIFADNDVRVLRLPLHLSAQIDEAREAVRNGWEVRISVVPVPNSGAFEITEFTVISRVNRLTDGFSQPDRNFRVINLSSSQQVQELFNSVYPYESDNYDVNDNCYNRAHFWSRSYQASQERRNPGLGTEKVFIFFTQAYTSTFDHKWWFHVAPMVNVNNRPMVLDPTFLDRAVSLQNWLATFDHHTDGQCDEIQSIEEYYERNNEPVCLYIRASMFNYSPSDLHAAPRRLNNWRCYDFQRLMSAIPAPGAGSSNPNASWSDRDNANFLPAMCR